MKNLLKALLVSSLFSVSAFAAEEHHDAAAHKANEVKHEEHHKAAAHKEHEAKPAEHHKVEKTEDHKEVKKEEKK